MHLVGEQPVGRCEGPDRPHGAVFLDDEGDDHAALGLLCLLRIADLLLHPLPEGQQVSSFESGHPFGDDVGLLLFGRGSGGGGLRLDDSGRRGASRGSFGCGLAGFSLQLFVEPLRRDQDDAVTRPFAVEAHGRFVLQNADRGDLRGVELLYRGALHAVDDVEGRLFHAVFVARIEGGALRLAAFGAKAQRGGERRFGHHGGGFVVGIEHFEHRAARYAERCAPFCVGYGALRAGSRLEEGAGGFRGGRVASLLRRVLQVDKEGDLDRLRVLGLQRDLGVHRRLCGDSERRGREVHVADLQRRALRCRDRGLAFAVAHRAALRAGDPDDGARERAVVGQDAELDPARVARSDGSGGLRRAVFGGFRREREGAYEAYECGQRGCQSQQGVPAAAWCGHHLESFFGE